MTSSTACPSCRSEVESGRHGCQATFDQMLAADFSDYRRMPHHRLLVDLYCLQHPDEYCRSAKSYAAHLTGLCCTIEYGNNRTINTAVQRWLSGGPDLQRPALPDDKGSVTVLHVSGEQDLDEYAKRLAEWAEDVWTAYSAHHEQARKWINTALAAGSKTWAVPGDPLIAPGRAAALGR